MLEVGGGSIFFGRLVLPWGAAMLGLLLCLGILMRWWNALGVGTSSLEIVYCGIVEGYPRRDRVCP